MKYNRKQREEIEKYLDKHNCARCNSTKELTIDHIIPLSFLIQQLGATSEETFDWDNFQPLCRKCNTLKAGRFDLSNEKTKPLLIRYINKYCK
jgi:5-methylcytosine-specific restriction endonuclease McrA